MEGKKEFIEKVKLWSDNASLDEFPDWQDQMRMLSEMADLISPELTLEEVISVIYATVNKLMDAYQFAVGIYDEEEGVIIYKGLIENQRQYPDFSISAVEDNRLSSWCIRNETEIFINDFEKEYKNYLQKKPEPVVGSSPLAALYVPLRLNNKIVGIITVRTIHKNVYQRHHLYILKTLGDFVIRALALGREISRPSIRSQAAVKNWKWNEERFLSNSSRKNLHLLTEREKDVLFLMVTGASNKVIAEKLFVSPGTVKTHTINIYQKMQVTNRTSAIMKAVEMQWIV